MARDKNYLCFISLKFTACMSTAWSAVLYLVYFFLSLCKTKYLGSLANISFNMLWIFFFYNLRFLKALRELGDVFRIFFKRVGDLCVILFFLIFSKSFFFTAFLSMNIKIVSKGNKTKTCVNKSFDVIIKYTLHVLLAFTV